MAWARKGHELIAIQDGAMLVNHDEAVRVPIQGQAHVRPQFPDPGGNDFRIKGTAMIIDIEAVRLAANPENFRAQFFQCKGGRLVACAICAIYDDSQPG